MADTVEKIIKIEAAGSEQTVRGLKKEIDSLRDALLNTEKGTDEYKKVLEQLIGDQKQLADVMSAGKNEVSAATGSYNALKNEMSALKKVWAEVTDEASRSQIGARIDEINTELKKMDASIGNYQRNVGNYTKAFKSSRQELAALKTQMDNLQVGTEEYNQAFQRAAEITHTLQERQEMLKYSAADLGTQLSNVASIGSSLVAGFNSINAVMALTGNKSEELQKTMVKLQAGIALVQGLQGLEGMTKRMRGFLDGTTAMVFGTKSVTTAVEGQTAAIGANTAAMGANATATQGATVATKGFQKALVGTGIGAIIVLLGDLVANWNDYKEVLGITTEKVEQFNTALDKIKVVVGGVVYAINNVLIASLKNGIVTLATMGKVLKDIFTLNFDQIGKDIQDGFNKIQENVKKGYDVVENYREGAAKKQARLEDKRTRQRMAASAEELAETIKDNEAKYGSDWKYTQDAKKLYDEYYRTKLASLKKDTKEYREAQREMIAYNREFNEHRKKANDAAAKAAEEATKKELEEVAKIEKRAADSQKTKIQLLTEEYEKEKALLEKYGKDVTNLTKEYEAKVTKIKEEEEAKKQAAIEKTREKEKREARERALNVIRHSRNNLQNINDEYTNEKTRIELEYSWKEAKNSGALSYNDIIEQTNRLYQANKEYLEAQAAEYKSLMENVDADDETRLDAKRDYYNTLTELDNLATQNLIDNTNLKREAINNEIQMYQQLGEAIADIFGSIADIMQDDIQQRVKNGEITEEEGEKQFKAVKAFQIAQATINTISGAIAAFMSCQQTYPQPAGAIIGAVQAAAVTAAGVAQIAKIKSTQLGTNSTVSTAAGTAVQTAPEEYQPQMYQNPTGESEITKLADSIKDQRVYVVESDISDAQRRSKVRITESTW